MGRTYGMMCDLELGTRSTLRRCSPRSRPVTSLDKWHQNGVVIRELKNIVNCIALPRVAEE